MYNKVKHGFLLIGILTIGYSSKMVSSETWIDYDGISKISLGVSQDVVISTLGEPVLILAESDGDVDNISLYYNYQWKILQSPIPYYLRKNNYPLKLQYRVVQSAYLRLWWMPSQERIPHYCSR